ncbi:MAG: hypothetical protein SynsKO_08030 [Synoicihabitans sp.]
MTTFLSTILKISLIALAMWWVLHNAPMIMAPIFGVVAVLVSAAGFVLLLLTLGVTVGLATVVGILIFAGVVATALAPVWLPLLAIVGLIALCRPKTRVAA